jgi:bifunctional non-homologous end joining protein LigD
MALEEYKKKRNFAKTPEPAGDSAADKRAKKAAKSGRFFCVQKHLASHLHYDFRLEWNGVLLSWAVPKGPSLNPADKRLAMHVEDHPIEYGSFEGVIPEGYGAGIVMLWDRGTWEPESEDVDAALKKGDLKFRLDGFKLKGSWVLVRTGGYGGRFGQPGKSWLLIKHRDDWSGPIDITTFAPLSVKTPDADLADILAADNPEIWHSHAPAKGGDTGAMFQRIIARALEIRTENTQVPRAKVAGAGVSGAEVPDAGVPAAPKRAQRRRASESGGAKKTPAGRASKAKRR